MVQHRDEMLLVSDTDVPSAPYADDYGKTGFCCQKSLKNLSTLLPAQERQQVLCTPMTFSPVQFPAMEAPVPQVGVNLW